MVLIENERPVPEGHQEQEKELQIRILESKRFSVNALALIFCIPLIYHKELGFYFVLRSLFLLHVFQAVSFQGRLYAVIVWVREGSWALHGLLLHRMASQGTAASLSLTLRGKI